MENTRNRQSRRSSQDSSLFIKALKNAIDLLGDTEQKENVFRFLQTECEISFDELMEIDEKKIAAAFAELFGRGGELLMRRLREETARLRAQSQKRGAAHQLTDLETLQ